MTNCLRPMENGFYLYDIVASWIAKGISGPVDQTGRNKQGADQGMKSRQSDYSYAVRTTVTG